MSEYVKVNLERLQIIVRDYVSLCHPDKTIDEQLTLIRDIHEVLKHQTGEQNGANNPTNLRLPEQS